MKNIMLQTDAYINIYTPVLNTYIFRGKIKDTKTNGQKTIQKNRKNNIYSKENERN